MRTPAEFEQGHVPGARNLPLFSNAERAEVGTLYKQDSPQAAFLRGLDFAGEKMRWYVERAMELAPDRRVILHCWRGGRRSGSMAWLLAQAGFSVQTVEGGYKGYRNYVRETFAGGTHQFRILGGATGSGKTHILHALRAAGEPVLDLEGLAHHKGSSFGALGESPQPTTEQFENDLFVALAQFPADRPIWVEDESRNIGHVYLPDVIWERMLRSELVILDIPLEARLDNLVADYADFSNPQLAAAFERITKRLGGQHVQAALAALETGDYRTAAAIALRYYDKAYQRHMDQRPSQPKTPFRVTNPKPAAVAESLIAAFATGKV